MKQTLDPTEKKQSYFQTVSHISRVKYPLSHESNSPCEALFQCPTAKLPLNMDRGNSSAADSVSLPWHYLLRREIVCDSRTAHKLPARPNRDYVMNSSSSLTSRSERVPRAVRSASARGEFMILFGPPELGDWVLRVRAGRCVAREPPVA